MVVALNGAEDCPEVRITQGHLAWSGSGVLVGFALFRELSRLGSVSLCSLPNRIARLLYFEVIARLFD